MADSWAKLLADLKKATTEAKKYSLSEANKLFNVLNVRDKLLEAHEKAFSKAAIAAYERGMKSTTLAEFLKDHDVAEAKKNLDTDRRLLVGEIEDLDNYCLACDKTGDMLDKLMDVAAKALKAAAKDKSPDKILAEKMRDALVVKLKDINEAAAMRFRVEKYLTSFNGQYDKFVAHLLETALKNADDKKDDELPQPLVDKKLTAAHNLADAELTKIKDAVKDAEDAKDPKAAALAMKQAQTALAGLSVLSKKYEKVKTDFKKQIVASKDRKDIESKIKDIVESVDVGRKLCTEAAAKLRKMA
jgi:hypothetical protein